MPKPFPRLTAQRPDTFSAMFAYAEPMFHVLAHFVEEVGLPPGWLAVVRLIVQRDTSYDDTLVTEPQSRHQCPKARSPMPGPRPDVS